MLGHFSTICAAAIALVIQAAPAWAAGSLTFVSATGNDSNPCTHQAQPCKTLQRAHNETLPGGEVRLLSSLAGQIAVITKSVTVNGGGHTVIGAIVVNSAPAVVTLRDLSLNGRATAERGVNILTAAAVHIENCSVERYTEEGVRLAPNVSTELFISGSVVRDIGVDAVHVYGPSTAKLTVKDTRILNAAWSGLVIDGGQASVSESVLSGHVNTALYLSQGEATATEVIVSDSPNGFVAVYGAKLTLDSVVARSTNVALTVPDTASEARISESVFTDNNVGVANLVGGTVYSLGNNLIAGNWLDVNGSLTPLAAK